MRDLGMYAWFGYAFPLKDRLKMIKEAGFSTTFLWFGHEQDIVASGRADDMPHIVEDSGLRLDSIHAPYWDHHLMWTGAVQYLDKARTELDSTLDFCARHRIAIMVAHLGGSGAAIPDGSALDLVSELVKKAEDLGVIVAAENGEGGLQYMDYLLSTIHSPSLRFCYDSCHDCIADSMRGQALQKWGHLLVTTHLSDSLGVEDDHLLPGRGIIEWETVKKKFPDGYRGPLMLEVDGPNAARGLAPQEFLRLAYSWLAAFNRDLNDQPQH